MKKTLAMRPSERHEDVIVFTVSGFRFAVAAAAVSEIRGTDRLCARQHVSEHFPKVEYALQRGSASCPVVNAAKHFQLPAGHPTRVLVLRNGTAVLVDSTDRMTEIAQLHALPQAFTHEERKWYRGLAVITGNVVPVVHYDTFLTNAEQQALLEEIEKQGTTVG